MKKEKVRLGGVLVPDWYLDSERELLECLLQLEEAKRSYRKARSRIRELMSAHGIDGIDSELLTVSLYDPSVVHRVDTRKLRRLFPEIWEKCVVEHSRGKRLCIRLK